MFAPRSSGTMALAFALPLALTLVKYAAHRWSEIELPAPVVMAGVVAGVVAVFLPVRWLLYGVILAIPFDNYAAPVGPLRISLSDALLVVVTLRWLLAALYRGGRISRCELYLPAALFYMLLLPSFFVTFDFALSLRHAFSILMMLLTAIVTANLLRSEARLMGGVTAILAASAIMSLLFFVQLFIWMRYQVSLWHPLVDFVRLGGLSLPRFTATYLEPNYFALYLIAPLVLGLFVALERGLSPRYRAFAWFVVSLDLAVFVMTFSRGGWVTLLAFMAIFVVLRARAPARGAWLVMLIAVVAVTPMVASVFVGINPSSIASRATLIRLGLEVMAQHPLVGTGLGTFVDLPQNILQRIAHSTYLQIGADAGIPALLAFFMLMIVVAFNALGALRDSTPGVARAVLTGCLFALGCIAVQSAFLNALVLKHIWVVVGLTSGAAAVARAEAVQDAARGALPPSGAPG